MREEQRVTHGATGEERADREQAVEEEGERELPLALSHREDHLEDAKQHGAESTQRGRRASASSRRSQSKSVSNINQPIEETANTSNNVLLMGGHHTVEEELNIDLLAPESLLSSLTPATKKQLVPPILKLNDNDLLITSVIFVVVSSFPHV